MKTQCKKCLLREFDKDGYMENIQRIIDDMDEDDKVDTQTYEARLTICTECDYLREGFCGACGCFAELRAAVKSNSCPYNKWKKKEDEV